jgi:uncharacterized membrane protein (DUF4010 family)
MPEPYVQPVPIPSAVIAVQLAAALGIGMLVGFEREWANKEFGLRAFAFISLLGMMAAHLPAALAAVAFVGVLLLISIAQLNNFRSERPLELNTSTALLLVFAGGYLVGAGHVFTPVAASVVITMLLAWKLELKKFAGGLTLDEIRSAVILGLLGFVIYPVMPDRFVDPWELINPRQAWITVIIIAGLGFINYVLLKIYGTRGIYFSGFLGGLVNSSAAAAQLARPLGAGNVPANVAVAALLLTIVAMFARNLLILAILAPPAFLTAAAPLGAMGVVAALFAQHAGRRAGDTGAEVQLESPVSITYVLNFSLLFLVIQVVARLGERHLGKFGFLGISALGGFVSSASTSAAAANMVHHGRIAPELAGIGVVLASVASALVNLPLVQRNVRNPALFRRLAVVTFILCVLGLLILAVREFHRFWNL